MELQKFLDILHERDALQALIELEFLKLKLESSAVQFNRVYSSIEKKMKKYNEIVDILKKEYKENDAAFAPYKEDVLSKTKYDI